MALVLPVVDSHDPQVDSSARGDADVHTGRIDDETDQKKFTGKELSKGKNKNFVPLVKSQTKKKPGEEPEADPEEDPKKEAKEDRGSCGKKDSAKAKKADGCGCDHKKKKKKDGGPYLTAGAMKKLDKKGKGDPCWAGYEQAGTKMKGGKRVPNCIPTAGGKKKDSYKKDAAREDLKCGKGAISKGEKCTKGQTSQAKGKKKSGGLGSRFGGGIGGTSKAIGLGALEVGKWGSGYNIGKAVAGGEGAKRRSGGSKAVGTVATNLFLGPVAAAGYARRTGLFGETDLEANKRFRRRGDTRKPTMKKDSAWAEGFKFDGKCLHMESEKLAATDLDRAKRKKNAQGQPRNKIISGTRNT